MPTSRSFISHLALPGVLSLAAICALEAPAAACGQECLPPVQLPSGKELPGDRIYFALRVDDPGTLVLRSAAGEPIPAHIRSIGNDRVFAPDAPVEFGTELVLEYTSNCGVVSSFAFVAAPHGELELRPGALIVDEQGTAHPGQVGERRFVRLRYFSPDSNGYGEALMKHTFTLDGVSARTIDVAGFDMIEVAVQCQPLEREALIDTCGVINSVGPGVHRVVATTTIVGETTQPEPVSLDVEVVCGADDSDRADDVDDAGRAPAQASDGVTASVDDRLPGAAPAASSAAHSEADAAAGCGLSRPGAGALGVGPCAALLLALVSRARTRRRLA